MNTSQTHFGRRIAAAVLLIALLLAAVIASLVLSTKDFHKEPAYAKPATSTTLPASTTKPAEEKKEAKSGKDTKATKTTASERKTEDNAKAAKVIYLTFDDGPGPYTKKLLKTLDKYGVKATFFVTNQFPKYQDLIGEEAEEGHAIANHMYSHTYSRIYADPHAFWTYYNKMNKVIEKQTGYKTYLLRFPGGSSNTVSRYFESGIMTALTKECKKRGITYVDWNVDCNDAGGANTSDAVYYNLINGVQQMTREKKPSVLLCHDIHPQTVNAMPRFIKWAKSHGYTFELLSPDGFTVHMPLNN